MTTREDNGKALQDRVGALEREVSVQKPPAENGRKHCFQSMSEIAYVSCKRFSQLSRDTKPQEMRCNRPEVPEVTRICSYGHNVSHGRASALQHCPGPARELVFVISSPQS